MSAQVEAAFQSGVAALREGRASDAERFFQEVIALDARHGAALYNLGVLHYQANRLVEAEAVLSRASAVRPSHVGTRSVLAAVSVALKKIESAVTHADVIIGRETADASALHSAGQVMELAGCVEDAEKAYRRALTLEPTYRLPAIALVRQLLSRRAFAEAVAVCETVLKHLPKDQDLHLRRAQALWEGGQTVGARDALLNLLDFAPDHITAHYNLSLFASQTDPQTVIDRLVILLAEGDLPLSDAVKVWFALGNLHASQDQAEVALACFLQGNDLRQSVATDQHAQSSAAFEARVEAIVRSPLPDVSPIDSDLCPTPLIIAGPSRSGKSLLQAWLSAHPDIAAADEVGVLPKLAERDYAKDPEGKAEAARSYRATLQKLGGSARYVIDTHPTNILYLDLLLDLCPDAKIIQVKRDPLDLAVSTLFRNFVTGGHWADTWRGIAARLLCYDKLRDHWQPWSPVISTLCYEDVVQNPNEVLRHVIRQLGLPQSQAMDMPEHPLPDSELKPVPWASFADRPQANADSIGLWKPFAPWLSTFVDAYGREGLVQAHVIPTTPVVPRYELTQALKAIQSKSVVSEVENQYLANVPAFHAAQAEQSEVSDKWDEALAARWRAVSCRPFTSRLQKHVDALAETIQRSPGDGRLAALHQDLSRMWRTYGETSGLRFGDFGLSYQSCAPVFIPGSRDTDLRAQVYGLQDLCAGKHVLDLGCNAGFLGLAAATKAQAVTGIEKEPALVEIGQRVATYLNAKNCKLLCGDVNSALPDAQFDLVIAAAIHGWIGMPLADLGERFAKVTSPGGAVLFESQGQRSTTVVEADFEDKVRTIASAGFQVERAGQICDDRVNLRAFVILRKV